MKWPAFIGGSFQPQALTADNSRTVNFYVEPSQGEGATVPASLYPSPGFVPHLDPSYVSGAYTGDGRPRGHYFIDSREFIVIESTLFEVAQDGTLTNRGSVGSDEQPVSFSSNGDVGRQVFITSNRNGFIFDLDANTLTQIAALNGIAFQGDYLDGYFLLLDNDTSKLYVSALADGTTWTTGTDFAQRSLRGDPWVAMKVCGRFIWLFGEQTSEIWYNTADTFPFAPHPSGLLNYGIRAPWSTKVIGTALIWMGKTDTGRLSVLRGEGFTPQVISTYALDLKLGQTVDPSQAYADVMSFAGHTFYLLAIGDDVPTLVFDSTTNTWVEWMRFDSSTGTETAWSGRFHAAAFDQNRVLDRLTGRLYYLDPTSSAETTSVTFGGFKRIRRCPAPFAENKRIFFHDLELDLEPGLGLQTTPFDPAPQVMLRISNDGGKTWPVERWESAGTLGEYGTRVGWTRLGTARRRVFEVSMTDRSLWKLTGAYLEAKAENG